MEDNRTQKENHQMFVFLKKYDEKRKRKRKEKQKQKYEFLLD